MFFIRSACCCPILQTISGCGPTGGTPRATLEEFDRVTLAALVGRGTPASRGGRALLLSMFPPRARPPRHQQLSGCVNYYHSSVSSFLNGVWFSRAFWALSRRPPRKHSQETYPSDLIVEYCNIVNDSSFRELSMKSSSQRLKRILSCSPSLPTINLELFSMTNHMIWRKQPWIGLKIQSASHPTMSNLSVSKAHNLPLTWQQWYSERKSSILRLAFLLVWYGKCIFFPNSEGF